MPSETLFRAPMFCCVRAAGSFRLTRRVSIIVATIFRLREADAVGVPTASLSTCSAGAVRRRGPGEAGPAALTYPYFSRVSENACDKMIFSSVSNR